MADLDLDVATESPPGRRPFWIAILALLLMAAAAGAGTRALTVRAEEQTPVVGGRLTLNDAYLDPAPGGAVATLRLLLQNDGDAGVRVRSLTVEGLSSNSDEFRLERQVEPGAAVVIDLVVRPSCAYRDREYPSAEDGPMTARISLSRGGAGRAGTAVVDAPVLTSRGLGQPGGLCRQLAAMLPAGWHSPLSVGDIAVSGTGLQVGIGGLPSSVRIGGVWAGTQLLSAKHGAVAGEGYRLLQLARPARCPLDDDTSRIPTGLRILAIEDSGLHEHYAPVGPTLAIWLRGAC